MYTPVESVLTPARSAARHLLHVHTWALSGWRNRVAVLGCQDECPAERVAGLGLAQSRSEATTAHLPADGPGERRLRRHFPNERAHPGAEFMSRSPEAARQARTGSGRGHDWLYDHARPLTSDMVTDFARELGLDMDRFARDLDSDDARAHVSDDLEEARRNGVTGTPTFFIDGLRYDGAMDYNSMLEALERPVAAQIHRGARAFANLPASGGMVLILAAALALICANTPLAPYYHAFVATPIGIGTQGSVFSLTAANWFSEGLLAIFFLLVSWKYAEK